MAIADQFTRLMGGEIFVDSKIDIGTDFSVYITLKKASGEVEAKSKEVEEDDTKEYSYSGLRILLAEDNETENSQKNKDKNASPKNNIKSRGNIYVTTPVKSNNVVYNNIPSNVSNGTTGKGGNTNVIGTDTNSNRLTDGTSGNSSGSGNKGNGGNSGSGNNGNEDDDHRQP